jgi:hypothetical protein
MKLPAEAKLLLKTILKGLKKDPPPGMDVLFQAEWSMPSKADGMDYEVMSRMAGDSNVVNVLVVGTTPDKGTITVLIQAAGLDEVPSELRRFTNART